MSLSLRRIAVLSVVLSSVGTSPALGVLLDLSPKLEAKLTIDYKQATPTSPTEAESFSFIVYGVDKNDQKLNLASTDFKKMTGGPLKFERTINEVEGLRISFRDDDNPLPKDKTQTVTLELDPDKVKARGITDIRIVRNKSGWYGPVGSSPIRLGVPIGGLKGKGDPLYQIFNNDSDGQTLDVRDLQFLNNVPEMDLDTLDPLSSSPFGTPMGDRLLSPDGASELFDVGSLDEGNFFYSRAHIYENGEMVGSFIHGYGFPVPEPATLTLLAAGGLVLSPSRRRQ